jgi:hypothetical protein
MNQELMKEKPTLQPPHGSKQQCDYVIELALWLFKLGNQEGNTGLSDLAGYAEWVANNVEDFE